MLKGLIKVRLSVGKETSMLFDCNMIPIRVAKMGASVVICFISTYAYNNWKRMWQIKNEENSMWTELKFQLFRVLMILLYMSLKLYICKMWKVIGLRPQG